MTVAGPYTIFRRDYYWRRSGLRPLLPQFSFTPIVSCLASVSPTEKYCCMILGRKRRLLSLRDPFQHQSDNCSSAIRATIWQCLGMDQTSVASIRCTSKIRWSMSSMRVQSSRSHLTTMVSTWWQAMVRKCKFSTLETTRSLSRCMKCRRSTWVLTKTVTISWWQTVKKSKC